MATEPLQRLINAAFRQSAGLEWTLDRYESISAADWLIYGDQAAKHLYLVVRGSPRRSLEQLLARPDVRDVVEVLMREAARKSELAVRTAWSEGIELGIQAANADLGVVGLPRVDPSLVSLDETVLERLVRDVNENASRTTNLIRTQDIIPGNHERTRDLVTIRTRDSSKRARMSAEAAVKYAHAEAKEAVFRVAQRTSGTTLWKVWVTRFRPGTCPTCARLHGTRVHLGQSFPVDATFAPQRKRLGTLDTSLGHPPRHPNCGCRIIVWSSAVEPEGARVSIRTMVAFADRWWAKLMRVTRRRS